MTALGNYDDGSPVELNVKALVGTNTMAIAAPGGGKSGLLRKLLETTYGMLPHVVFDPDDEFFTLREVFDYLVVGGDTGDAPATVGNAADLARMVLEHRVSLVIQMNHLRDEDPQLFVDVFLRTVMDAPRSQWKPLLIVLDEAQRFIPEGADVESSQAVKDVMARGRKRGISVVLASQRLSHVAKSATEVCQNWFLGITGLGNDLKRSCEALGISPKSAEGREITTMRPRTFWCYGPATDRVPRRFYVADVQTTIPQIGEAPPPTPPAPSALKGLLEALTRAAAAALPTIPGTSEPAAQALSPAARDAISLEGHRKGYLEGHGIGVKQGFSGALGELRPVIKRLEALAYGADPDTGVFASPEDEVRDAKWLSDRTMGEYPNDLRSAVGIDISTGPDDTVVMAVKDGTDGVAEIISSLKVTPALQKILDALAYMDARRRQKGSATTRSVLGFLIGMSPAGGGFRNYLSSMKTAGLITYPSSDMVALTPAGQALAKPPRMISNKQVQDACMDRIDPAVRRILEHLLDAYPNALTRDALADRAGYAVTGGGFRNYLSRLNTLEMVTYPDRGSIRASDLLFPENAR